MLLLLWLVFSFACLFLRDKNFTNLCLLIGSFFLLEFLDLLANFKQIEESSQNLKDCYASESFMQVDGWMDWAKSQWSYLWEEKCCSMDITSLSCAWPASSHPVFHLLTSPSPVLLHTAPRPPGGMGTWEWTKRIHEKPARIPVVRAPRLAYRSTEKLTSSLLFLMN